MRNKIFLLLLLCLWLCLLFWGATALYNLFTQYRLFTVISGSMEPALHTGCIIVVDARPDTIYTPGDIITFREEKEFITHRITDLYYDGHFYYRTQGDANERPDQNLVPHQAVVGRVVFATGTILTLCINFLRSRLFFLTFIIFTTTGLGIRFRRKKTSG
ncbi:MAG: signal peptidase I [Firmicutes bacterium]|nr:signal peptidase I [Bacillota bacterium]